MGAKAARKMLVKLTTVVYFINILSAACFCADILSTKKSVVSEKLNKTLFHKKAAHKILVKLTTECFTDYDKLNLVKSAYGGLI